MHNTVNTTGVLHTTGVSVRSVESSVQVIAVSALLQRTGGSASRTYCSSGPCLSVTVSRQQQHLTPARGRQHVTTVRLNPDNRAEGLRKHSLLRPYFTHIRGRTRSLYIAEGQDFLFACLTPSIVLALASITGSSTITTTAYTSYQFEERGVTQQYLTPFIRSLVCGLACRHPDQL